MKDPENMDDMWQLIREGAPLPEAPPWFAARTVARLRSTQPVGMTWWRLRRFVWAGGFAVLLFSSFTTWQLHVSRTHDQQVTFAALDALSGGDKTHYQEEAWFNSY